MRIIVLIFLVSLFVSCQGNDDTYNRKKTLHTKTKDSPKKDILKLVKLLSSSVSVPKIRLF